MLRSLFAGISGLRTNQVMLDVTGNNIANANTIGYKASTTVFKDTLSQMLTGAASSSPGRGGVNPMQVGLGVQVSTIATNLGQGAAQTTGRTTDMMIQGDGMFVVHNGTEELYTRAGAFTFDEQGYLTTPSGNIVQGYQAPVPNPIPAGTKPVDVQINFSTLKSYSIGADGMVRGVDAATGNSVDLFQLAIADFNNPMGLEKVGETSYRTSANSGQAQLDVAGAGRRGTLLGGALEMSNVDLSAEFTNLILAQRGFQASSRVITTSDQVLEDLVNIKR